MKAIFSSKLMDWNSAYTIMLRRAGSSLLSQEPSFETYRVLCNISVSKYSYVFEVIEFVNANELSHFTLT